MLFYGQDNGVHVSDKSALIKYLNSAPANKLASKLEYSPLSAAVQKAVLGALEGRGAANPPACSSEKRMSLVAGHSWPWSL